MLRTTRAVATGLLLLVASAAGCAREQPKPAPARELRKSEPEVVLRPDGAEPARVKVELARTEPEQRKGLMYRDKLETGRGMLFIFPQAHQATFWMHNTYISLDMIFIGPDRRVVGVVERAQPLTDDPRGVEGVSQYVLEVPAGYSSAHRIHAGTPVEFVDVEEKAQ